LQDGFVKNVADVVKVGDTVQCRVLSVDVAGKRLALTRKGMGFGGRPSSAPRGRREEEEEGEWALLAAAAAEEQQHSAMRQQVQQQHIARRRIASPLSIPISCGLQQLHNTWAVSEQLARILLMKASVC
jgi:transcriptional accessory protein Tex/SPT6